MYVYICMGVWGMCIGREQCACVCVWRVILSFRGHLELEGVWGKVNRLTLTANCTVPGKQILTP